MIGALLAKAAALVQPELARERELRRILAGAVAVGARRDARPASRPGALEVALEGEVRALEVRPVGDGRVHRPPPAACGVQQLEQGRELAHRRGRLRLAAHGHPGAGTIRP